MLISMPPLLDALIEIPRRIEVASRSRRMAVPSRRERGHRNDRCLTALHATARIWSLSADWTPWHRTNHSRHIERRTPPVPSRQGSRRACKPSSELCAAQEKWLAILHWKCS